MTRSVFITGISSGLGLGLAQTYLDQGWTVFGLSRRGCALHHTRLRQVVCDIADERQTAAQLPQLLDGVERLDLVVLNAGVLGEIRDLADTSMAAIQRVMEINVWANKRLIDDLVKQGVAMDQLVAISSGAAVNGSRGWGAYALSKATLNMLVQLYAQELPATHFCALAPGLVDTAMQAYLCDPAVVDEQRYPSMARLRAARGTEAMPSPQAAAQRIAEVIPALRQVPSGSFRDMRAL